MITDPKKGLSTSPPGLLKCAYLLPKTSCSTLILNAPLLIQEGWQAKPRDLDPSSGFKYESRGNLHLDNSWNFTFGSYSSFLCPSPLASDRIKEQYFWFPI